MAIINLKRQGQMLNVLLENEFGRIELYELADGLQALQFFHQKGQGSISLYGGQVLSWQPEGQQPVFWLSDTSHYSTGKAIRAGVPLCWPWFGGEVKLPNGELSKVSNHGFARQSEWKVDDIEISASTVEVTLSLTGKDCSPYWPAAFELKQTDIPMLNDVLYDDKINGCNDQKSTLKHCMGPIDRIYHNNDNMFIVDHEWQRKIEVISQGCQDWVLWNPGKGAEDMLDVHAQGEHEFVCLEAANTDWQQITSQSSVSIGQTIKLHAL